ncbi:MAG: hypothetical protein Q9195_005483 [Heterodermia aff. obscurata]
MDFVTLAMLIIDDIFYPIPRLPSLNVLGGAGSYAVLGARLVCGPKRSNDIGWTIHQGSDFPEAVKRQIDTWRTSCNFIETPNRLTTRALNVYSQNEVRGFEFTSPKIRIDESTLTKEQLAARSFHFACSPNRCIDLVKGILAKREELCKKGMLVHEKPYFAWEPVPGLCIPSELDNLYEAIRYVDMVSPNLEELGAFFGLSFSANGDVDMARLLGVCKSILFKHPDARLSCIIVRMGHWGCLVVDQLAATMIEPYHQAFLGERTDELRQSATISEKVIDPTGAGNAFLGGFCMGLGLSPIARFVSLDSAIEGRLLMASICGTIAASFAVEQVGMPVITDSAGQPEKELWNEDNVWNRIEHFASTKVRSVWVNKK